MRRETSPGLNPKFCIDPTIPESHKTREKRIKEEAGGKKTGDICRHGRMGIGGKQRRRGDKRGKFIFLKMESRIFGLSFCPYPIALLRNRTTLLRRNG
jgi:hypothetical protein